MHTERVAIVTGSTSGIGLAVAKELLVQGYRVIINGRRRSKVDETIENLSKEFGVTVQGVVGDTSDRNVCKELARVADEHYGILHAVVHVPAVRPAREFADITEEEWDQVLNVNLKSLYHLAKATVDALVASGSGRLVAFSGATAFSGRRLGAHVAASKWGVVGLVRSIAYEYGLHGLTANVMVPGPIEKDDPVEEQSATHARHRPWRTLPLVGRFGRPQEVAAAVAYLVSANAGFVTGQSIHVNGGSEFY